MPPPHSTTNVTESGPAPFDKESITVAATAIGCTATTYLESSRAEMTLETAQIRFWLSGTPTSSEGHLIEVGDVITLTSPAQIAGFKAIRTGAVSGVLKVTYFK